ncbi:MAG: hypothetical protein ACI943_000796, partial [Gammaproteobacteria bacterium]
PLLKRLIAIQLSLIHPILNVPYPKGHIKTSNDLSPSKFVGTTTR